MCPVPQGKTRVSPRAKKAAPGLPFRASVVPRLLGGLRGALAGIAFLELVHAAGGIDDLLLAGVEGMRLGGNLDLVDRIFLAVLPLDGLVGRDRGARHEAEIAAGVEEHDLAVIGVDAVFHLSSPCGWARTLARAGCPGKPL